MDWLTGWRISPVPSLHKEEPAFSGRLPSLSVRGWNYHDLPGNIKKQTHRNVKKLFLIRQAGPVLAWRGGADGKMIVLASKSRSDQWVWSPGWLSCYEPEISKLSGPGRPGVVRNRLASHGSNICTPEWSTLIGPDPRDTLLSLVESMPKQHTPKHANSNIGMRSAPLWSEPGH